jgi:hypothetical protein
MLRFKTSRAWKAEDLRRLESMVASGFSAARASVALRRTMMSVKAKAKDSGFPFPDERQLKRERRGLPPLKLKSPRLFPARAEVA